MHENKICERCKIMFECKVGNILQCQCYGVVLNNDEQQHISKQYTDCICINCILALRTEFNTAKYTDNIKNNFGH